MTIVPPPPLCGLTSWQSALRWCFPGYSMLKSHNDVTTFLKPKQPNFANEPVTDPCCLPCYAVDNSNALNKYVTNPSEKVSIFTRCIGFFCFPFLIAQSENRVNIFKKSIEKRTGQQLQQQTYDAPRQQMLLRV